MVYLMFFMCVTFSILYIRYKYDMKALKRELISKSETMELSNGTIEYVITGDGPPVIISHGGAGGYDQGLLTAKLHLKSDFKVIAVSRFGHLRSSLPDNANAAMQADAYAELLSKLNIESASIIGTSGGGPSAIQFAIRHPQMCTSLVLSCAVSNYLEERDLKVYEHPFTYYLFIKYMQKFVLRQIGVTPDLYSKMSVEEKDNLNYLFKTMNPIELRRDGLYVEVKEWADKIKWEEEYDLSKILCPTLLIHAKDDTVVPFNMANATHQRLSNSEFLVLADGGHLKLGHKDLIQSKTSGFINKSIKSHKGENNDKKV